MNFCLESTFAPLSAVAELKQFQSHMSESLCVNVDQTRLHPLCLSTLDLGRDTLVTGKQVVEIKHTLKEPRSLADPVRTTGHTMELHLRDICWSQANGEFRNISSYLCVYQFYCIRHSKYLIMVGLVFIGSTRITHFSHLLQWEVVYSPSHILDFTVRPTWANICGSRC